MSARQVVALTRCIRNGEFDAHPHWSVLPHLQCKYLLADYDEKLAEYRSELAYIEQSLDKVRAEWKHWDDAYGGGAIDFDELKKRRNDITRLRKGLEVDRDELAGRIERIELMIRQ